MTSQPAVNEPGKTISPLKTFSVIICMLAGAFWILILYTFLHEGGHALAIMLGGGTLDSFSMDFITFTAHVSSSGLLLRPWSVINTAAGALLPLLVMLLVFLVFPKPKTAFAGLLSRVGAICVLGSQLPWVVIPFVYLAGHAPAGDDVTHFLNNSGWPPVLLSVAAVAVILLAFLVLRLRLGRFLEPFRTAAKDVQGFSFKKNIGLWLGMVVSTFLAFTMSFFLNRGYYANAVYSGQSPDGYRLVVEMPLDDPASNGSGVVAFTLDEPTHAGVFVRLEDVRTDELDITLTLADGTILPMLHAEEYMANGDSCMYENDLPAGTYFLEFTSRNGHGRLAVYLMP